MPDETIRDSHTEGELKEALAHAVQASMELGLAQHALGHPDSRTLVEREQLAKIRDDLAALIDQLGREFRFLYQID